MPPRAPLHATRLAPAAFVTTCIGVAFAAFTSSAPAQTSSNDIRKDIERTLQLMTDAVLAGNKAEYLKHVQLTDPYFATEQQHWADDLDKHKPVSFSLAIQDPPAPPTSPPVEDPPVDPKKRIIAPDFKDTRAEFQLRMTYKMTTGHASVGSGKSASWPVVFVKEDPDGPGPEPTQWLYAGEKWLTLTGDWRDHKQESGTAPATPPNAAAPAGANAPAATASNEAASRDGLFTIKYMPGAEGTAKDILAAFPPAKRHDDEGFEVTITRPLEIKLYTDMEHLKATVYLSMPDNILGGWNEPGESIKFMYNYTHTVQRWSAAFAHEYGHTATWELGPKIRDAPWWVHEGTAELAAEEFMHDRERIDADMRRRATLTGPQGLAKWTDLADYQTADQSIKQLAYYQGHAFIGWISDKWGRQGRNAWLRAMAQGKSLDDATREVFKVSFEDLDRQWRDSLRAPPAQKEQK